MVLRFAFDKRTVSGRRPLLDSFGVIVMPSWLVGRYLPISTWSKKILTGYSSMLDCLLRASVYSTPLWNKFLGWNSWFWFHIILYKFDRLLQYSVVLPGVSLISKSCLKGAENMLQCSWFVITWRAGRIAFFLPFKKIVFGRKLAVPERSHLPYIVSSNRLLQGLLPVCPLTLLGLLNSF